MKPEDHLAMRINSMVKSGSMLNLRRLEAAFMVVPLPKNGSRTVSPLKEYNSINVSGKASGNMAG